MMRWYQRVRKQYTYIVIYGCQSNIGGTVRTQTRNLFCHRVFTELSPPVTFFWRLGLSVFLLQWEPLSQSFHSPQLPHPAVTFSAHNTTGIFSTDNTAETFSTVRTQMRNLFCHGVFTAQLPLLIFFWRSTAVIFSAYITQQVLSLQTWNLFCPQKNQRGGNCGLQKLQVQQ